MQKIKIAIYGFGNLGQSLFKILQNSKEFKLVSVFSNRASELQKKYANVKFEQKTKVFAYKNKVDVLLFCDGSYKNLTTSVKKLATKFCIIDVFDDHKEIESYVKSVDKIAKQNKHVAVCACGWDPGIFSIMRALYSAVLPSVKTSTFWGRGISQGHSNAIRQIEGVENAVEFTIPKKEAINQAKKGVLVDETKRHKRECFVVCKKEDEKAIENKICTMPHYFLGYETDVNFASKDEFEKNFLKNLSHQGQVIGVLKNNKQKFCLNFKLELSSNPDFTAFVMIAYARACKKLFEQKKFGSYSVLDIPITYLLPNCNKFDFI